MSLKTLQLHHHRGRDDLQAGVRQLQADGFPLLRFDSFLRSLPRLVDLLHQLVDHIGGVLHALLLQQDETLVQQDRLGQQQLDLDGVVGVGERRLQDRVQQQHAVVVAPQAQVVAVPEQNFIVLGQIFPFDGFAVAI